MRTKRKYKEYKSLTCNGLTVRKENNMQGDKKEKIIRKQTSNYRVKDDQEKDHKRK